MNKTINEIEKQLNKILKNKAKGKIRKKTAIKRINIIKSEVLNNKKGGFRKKCQLITQYKKIIRSL